MSQLSLTAIRIRIDELDAQIQDLITQRAHLAAEVAQAKYLAESHPNFYRPERETEILRKIIARNQGTLSNEAFISIFREIMSACLAVQQPLCVAFLGPEGTYSQTAVMKHFGHAVQTLPVQIIDEVFREVEMGTAHYGVVPVENSTEGGVNQTLDCLVHTRLKICGEIELLIHHHLLSKATELSQIKCVYSHQQSLAQCRLWLDTHLMNIERIAVSSNAEAARRAVYDDTAAAIASHVAAEIYQLSILASRIEDIAHNTTRFAVIGRQEVPPTGQDKTSLLLASPNKPGILYQLLKPFADHAINLTHIESRPSRQGVWEYVFFVDIEGHIQDTSISKALEALSIHASLIKHLGSYPCAIR